MGDTDEIPAIPLDENLYDVQDDQALAFMKSETGIEDVGELKRHVINIQTEAYGVYPYPCIRRFRFIQIKLARLPGYQQLLSLGKERKGAIFLDIGCCFGNDIRKAVADGFPMEGAIGSDLHGDFWALGHKLFRSTPATFPVPFVAGDAFDPAHLAIVPPFYAPPETPVPQLNTLTSLNPMRGHVSAIHASSFFHLFDEEKQLQLAQALAGLLSPSPGSMIIGSHGGWSEKGYRADPTRPNALVYRLFCHCPESWVELWDGQVFKKGTVRVDAILREVERKDLLSVNDGTFYWLVWSVTRL
ncbi:hypothetical protein C8Q76DRAFT_286944 [Earliella scabrosa]|nr:hypothetical protein C8Q76DRAFT_286944 [Earliella scabrosa]